MCLPLRFRGKGLFIAINHPFNNMGCRYPWQIGAARGHGERQCEANEIVHRITNNGLVQITYLNS